MLVFAGPSFGLVSQKKKKKKMLIGILRTIIYKLYLKSFDIILIGNIKNCQ